MKNFLLYTTLAFASILSAQTDTEKASETVSKSEIEGHIYFLADDVVSRTKDCGILFSQYSA